MIMQDKLEKERNDVKNSLEEYVYEMRDKLYGALEKFVSEAVSGLHLLWDVILCVCHQGIWLKPSKKYSNYHVSWLI